ncbi:Nn.00g105600.m01.CDS01 [Neocucurbitaria sp. VM-36]
MKTHFRILYVPLFLTLAVLLARTFYYGLQFLRGEQHRAQPSEPPETQFVAERGKASPQEIAASMNTLWDMWDEEHCKNICEASWIACRLRHCDDLPDVRKQEL